MDERVANYRIASSIMKMAALVNARIAAAKYVHIMFNDKFCKPTADFINNNFDQKEHLFLCRRLFDNFPFPEGDNVVELISFAFLEFCEHNRIICHSLLDSAVVNYLFNNKAYLEANTYWLIWGGDLYGAPDDERHVYVRSHVRGYCASIAGDERLARDRYNPACQEMYHTPVKSPVAGPAFIGKTKIVKDHIKIQINNSSDASTLEMLSILKKFAKNDIRVTTVLSYGNMDYKDRIIKLGKFNFGDNFEYLDEFLSPEEYVEHLRSIDILVMNQDRQQGCGNIKLAAYLGAKVFIKKHLTHFKYFTDRGIQIYDTAEIKNMDFAQFIDFDDSIAAKNREQAVRPLNGISLRERWGKFFEAIR